MSDKTKQYEGKGIELVSSIYDQSEVSFEEIFNRNDLSVSERAVYGKHIETIGPFLQLYKRFWSIKFSQNRSKIKWLGKLLVILDSESVIGDKEKFIKKLFSESLHTVCKTDDFSFKIGTKSNEHEGILLELKVIALLVLIDF